MPSVRNKETVEAIAREYVDNGNNKAKALKAVGYTHDYCYGGNCTKLYKDIRIIEAIAKYEDEIRDKHVASRTERQRFWTKTLLTAPNMADKLRASELLGRSEADFTDNIQDSRADTPDPLSEQELTWLREFAGRMPHLSKETG